jgi:NAD/NADP transhydrogenase alpha subunit
VNVGASIVPTSAALHAGADIITRIRQPDHEHDEIAPLRGKLLVSMVQPSIQPELYHELVAQHTNVMALDCVPRMLSRGQAFDTVGPGGDNVAVNIVS